MQRSSLSFVASGFALALLVGCAGEEDPGDMSATATPEVIDCTVGNSAWPEEGAASPVRHAVGFSLEYFEGYKVLRTHPPADQGGGADVVVVVRCGWEAPPLVGSLADAHVIRQPVVTAAANEDLSLTRLRVLDRVDDVVAMGSGGIYDPSLRQLWEEEQAAEIGASFHGPPRFETLLEVAPDITFLSTASLANAGPLRRARELGLAAVPSVSWVEPTLLGQAEWLHQVAALLNEEERATDVLAVVEERYNALSEAAQGEAERPLILWIDPTGAGDRWETPSNSWKSKAVYDAGGRVAFALQEGAPTRQITSEEILALGNEIFAVMTESIALHEPGSGGALETLPAFREGRVFSVHKRSRPEHDAYDWYESAVVEVDRVLEDLVGLMHPAVLPNHDFHHLMPARRTSGP